ncbi:hypothetical protein KY314_02925 [Candidatus Woesearchaeota archaeon]|nr:hypothetical protein [Candidatus Woesearchaeota archaeon]
MYKNSSEKYISVDTDNFSFFLPTEAIDAIILFKTNSPNDTCNLYIYTKRNIGRDNSAFVWLDMSYDFSTKVYQNITSQFADNAFIDLLCDGSRIFIRESDIIGISCEMPPGTSENQIRLYRTVSSDYEEKSFCLKQSQSDIKPLYRNLLAQISYRPKKIEKAENNNQERLAKSMLWYAAKNNI